MVCCLELDSGMCSSEVNPKIHIQTFAIILLTFCLSLISQYSMVSVASLLGPPTRKLGFLFPCSAVNFPQLCLNAGPSSESTGEKKISSMEIHSILLGPQYSGQKRFPPLRISGLFLVTTIFTVLPRDRTCKKRGNPKDASHFF